MLFIQSSTLLRCSLTVVTVASELVSIGGLRLSPLLLTKYGQAGEEFLEDETDVDFSILD